MGTASQLARHKLLQHALESFPSLEDAPANEAASSALNDQVDAGLLTLAVLVPNNVLQQALRLVDTGAVVCVTSTNGRHVYKVQGKKETHIVLAHGFYCSCAFFGHRIIEACAGELCCKHWLAAQLFRRVGMPAGTASSGGAGAATVEEDDLVATLCRPT
eukprot:TRINITY_DN32595_c0_g1_i1.p1 TRINITY_DN32595_c0_g1~~TRINITY_DN32595_c0_g1_i1.p1  ORF type:complete len:172 (-),score=28.36 TRINITY_DN32595_c0_g1_i1:217-696(-)